MKKYNHDKILNHWNTEKVESMYDKYLLENEINLITKFIPSGSKILDAGCGEGEATLVYSAINNVSVQGVDFSETRLAKAKERLKNKTNVVLKKIDFTKDYTLDSDFDIVVSQRFIINITEWSLQQNIILHLISHLKEGGRLILMEGSLQGTSELNEFRKNMGLLEIDVPWHNEFVDDEVLKDFMINNGFDLECENGLGSYYLLTRGVRPVLDNNLEWDSEFNELAASSEIDDLLNLGGRFSRVKLWVFKKNNSHSD